MASGWTPQASCDPAERWGRAAEDMQSVEMRQNGLLTGLDFEWAVNQQSMSCVAIYA